MIEASRAGQSSPNQRAGNESLIPVPLIATPLHGINTVFGDGMVHVGIDVRAGTYRCEGVPGKGVYWERSSDASGESKARIANFFGPGPQYVSIKTGEFFNSNNSGGWVLVYLDE